MAGEIEEPFSLSFRADSIHSGSISFGRFEGEQLCWERRSSFSHNRYLEEVEKYSIPGSVTEKKAYFEARIRKKPLLSQTSSECQNGSEYQCGEYDTFENICCGEEQVLNKEVANPIHEIQRIDNKHNYLADDTNINKGSHSSTFDGSHSSIFDKSSEDSDLDDDCIVMEWFRETMGTPTTELSKEHTKLCTDEIIEPVDKPSIPNEVPLAKTKNITLECEEPDSEEKCHTEKTMAQDAISKAMQMAPSRCITEEDDTGSLDQQKLASKVKDKMEPMSTKSKPKSLDNLVRVQRRLAVEPPRDTAKKPNVNEQHGIRNVRPGKQVLDTSKGVYKSSETKVTNHNKSADKRLNAKTVAASATEILNKTPLTSADSRSKQVFSSYKPVVKKSDATSGIDDRAERRKKFYSKLKREKEVGTIQTQEKTQKKKKEADIKQVRGSLNFKATPMPSFYHRSGKNGSFINKEMVSDSRPSRIQYNPISSRPNPISRSSARTNQAPILKKEPTKKTSHSNRASESSNLTGKEMASQASPISTNCVAIKKKEEQVKKSVITRKVETGKGRKA